MAFPPATPRLPERLAGVFLDRAAGCRLRLGNPETSTFAGMCRERYRNNLTNPRRSRWFRQGLPRHQGRSSTRDGGRTTTRAPADFGAIGALVQRDMPLGRAGWTIVELRPAVQLRVPRRARGTATRRRRDRRCPGGGGCTLRTGGPPLGVLGARCCGARRSPPAKALSLHRALSWGGDHVPANQTARRALIAARSFWRDWLPPRPGKRRPSVEALPRPQRPHPGNRSATLHRAIMATSSRPHCRKRRRHVTGTVPFALDKGTRHFAVRGRCCSGWV